MMFLTRGNCLEVNLMNFSLDFPEWWWQMLFCAHGKYYITVCSVNLPWRAAHWSNWNQTLLCFFPLNMANECSTVCICTLVKVINIPEGSSNLSSWIPQSSAFAALCSLRGAAAGECDCDKFDFESAKALNKEGLNRFVQDRTFIAALNDRLVRLIKLVRTNTITPPNDTSALSFPSAVSCLCSWEMKHCVYIYIHDLPVLFSSIFNLSLFPLGPLFWGGKWVSWMSDCWNKGQAEQSTSALRHHLHRGWAWLQSGCSGGKTAQGAGRVLLQMGVSAACFSVCDIPKLGFLIDTAPLIPSHQFNFGLCRERQPWSITLSRSITVFTASPCRMRSCVTPRSCRKSLNVWWENMRRLHSRGSSSSRSDKMLQR